MLAAERHEHEKVVANLKMDVVRLREIAELYRSTLAGVPGIECLEIPEGVAWNYSYFPLLVKPAYGLSRDALFTHLASLGINGRRYFHPLISGMPMYRDLPSAAASNLPVATRIADEVLCLPLFPAMTEEDAHRVADAVAAAPEWFRARKDSQE